LAFLLLIRKTPSSKRYEAGDMGLAERRELEKRLGAHPRAEHGGGPTGSLRLGTGRFFLGPTMLYDSGFPL
jgi:hypothetical protein